MRTKALTENALPLPLEFELRPAIPCIYAVEQVCPSLAQQFGFLPDYDLTEALKGALRIHFGCRLNDQPETDSASRAALRELQKALPKVSKSLSALGPSSRFAIRHNLPASLKRNWHERIERDIKAIQAAILAATAQAAKVSQERGGGIPAHPERPLVLELDAIYEKGTGNRAKSHYNDAHETYQGGATKFISAVLSLCAKEVSAPLTDSQIGRMLYPYQSKHRKK